MNSSGRTSRLRLSCFAMVTTCAIMGFSHSGRAPSSAREASVSSHFLNKLTWTCSRAVIQPQCAKFRFGGILTPALSPPSDGTERGKRSQRLWKDLRLVGQDGQLDRQIMESEGGSTHRTQPPPKLAVHPAPETDLGAAEISQLHLCNADANIRHAFKGLFGRRQRH
jgi:hypothetical protein